MTSGIVTQYTSTTFFEQSKHPAYKQNDIRNIISMHFHCLLLGKSVIRHINQMASGIWTQCTFTALLNQKWHPEYTQNCIRNIDTMHVHCFFETTVTSGIYTKWHPEYRHNAFSVFVFETKVTSANIDRMHFHHLCWSKSDIRNINKMASGI